SLGGYQATHRNGRELYRTEAADRSAFAAVDALCRRRELDATRSATRGRKATDTLARSHVRPPMCTYGYLASYPLRTSFPARGSAFRVRGFARITIRASSAMSSAL